MAPRREIRSRVGQQDGSWDRAVRAGRPAGVAGSGSRGGGACFEDAYADGLSLGLDILHGFADARAGGLVSADGFLVVLFCGGDEFFEFLEGTAGGWGGGNGGRVG